jgi:hypothetical protein
MGDRADFFTVWYNTHFLNITLLHIEIGISYAASIHSFPPALLTLHCTNKKY